MTARKRAWWLAGVACLAMIPLHFSSALSADKGTVKDDGKAGAQALAQPGKGAPGRFDRGKNDVIEPAIKNLVKQGVPAQPADPLIKLSSPALDVGKYTVIESPVRNVVNGGVKVAPPGGRLDVGKGAVVEVGPKAVVNKSAPNPPPPPAAPKPRLDVGKRLVVEPAVKNLVGPGGTPVPPNGTPRTVAATTPPAPPASPKEFVNPKVDTGKIKWHATFEEACAAAKKSGKPVMLFQMMGKLDDQFC